MEEFELTKFDYIELNKLLKILTWVNSGGQANMIISDGEVFVNDKVETQKRKKLRKGDRVRFLEQEVVIK